VPHPSATNAYPSAPGFYPSGPDGILDVATGSRTGSPSHLFEQRDTAATGSRTGSQIDDTAQVGGVTDTTGIARTGTPGELGAGLGVMVADVPLHATTPSLGTLPGLDQLPLYTEQAEQSASRSTLDTWRVDVADRPVGSLSRTTVETSFGRSVVVQDAPTGSVTVGPPTGSLIDRIPQDTVTGSRSRTSPRDVIDRGMADVAGTARTVGPVGERTLIGWGLADPSNGVSSTGLQPDGASVEWVDKPSATMRTGLPNDGARPVWLIWPDVTGISRTGTPTTTYDVLYIDRAGPSASRTGLTDGEQSQPLYPEADPNQVTIFTYNYPDAGLYPVFYPGLSVPFGQLVPATIDPLAAPPLDLRYRLYLCDTISGRLAYELPYASLSWNTKMNNIGTMSATVVVQHVYDALSDADERDPRNLFAQFLASGSFRYSLALTYGNTVVWAGPYTPTSVPGGQPTITLGGSDFGAFLQRRLLVGNNPPAISSDVTIGPFTKPYLALELVRYSTSGGPGGGPWSLPWTCHDLPERAGTEMRTYYGYDLWTVWDALSTLSQERDGPDFRFDPELVPGADGYYLSWDMVIGKPILATPHEWGWDAPANATVAWDTNVSNFGTAYYGTGSGQDRSKIVAISMSDELLDLGFPVLQMIDSLHSSVIDQAELQALTDGDMRTYSRPSNRWTITVQASQPPLLGSYRVGDTIMLRVEQHPVIPDGVYHRRITSMGGGDSDFVTITSSDSLVVQSTTSTGIQVITSD
jgi:hypothetical protein